MGTGVRLAPGDLITYRDAAYRGLGFSRPSAHSASHVLTYGDVLLVVAIVTDPDFDWNEAGSTWHAVVTSDGLAWINETQVEAIYHRVTL